MTTGFADYASPASIPGPTLAAEVGDVLVVHFRNADTTLRQAVTMHPHGVKYNPEYDGAYMGEFTRAGGFIAPGESFTYQWECTPDSVGAWPYHDHGPNHTLNTFRGLFGAIIVRPRGSKWPDRVCKLFAHQLSPPVTGLDGNFHCFNGRAYAGNTPTLPRASARTSRSTRSAWTTTSTRSTSTATAGGIRRGHSSTTRRWDRTRASRPASSRTTRVAGSTTATSSPSGRGDGGLVRGRPVGEGEVIRISLIAAVVVALLAPAAASAQTYPEPKQPGPVESAPKGPHKTYTVCKKKSCDFQSIQKAVDKARAGDTIRVRDGVYREAVKVNGSKKRYLKLIGNVKHPTKVLLKRPGQHAERDLRQRRRRGHRRRLHGPRLQGQRVLLHEPQRLHDEPPDRAPDRGLRPLRVQHHRRHDQELRGLLRQRRRLLHRADAAAGQADPDDRHERRRLGFARSASAPRTCAT